jgi:exodeoxyribonuclease VII large subunit
MSQIPFNLEPQNLMPKRQVWKVSEVTAQIRVLLEGQFADVWVEGEVSNLHSAQSGHLYFTLKDAKSQLRCVCFRDQLRGVKFRPEDGLHVTVRGSISVYEVRGEYQIYVSQIEPVGLGALQLAFEQLKKRLEAEGLFAAERKKPLPVLPRRIGVVTSPTGAAVQDILRVLKRRFPNVHVQIFPVKVQGDGAAKEIVAAIQYFNRAASADVLILARGGGSLEDLWAFNEEIVARAISESVIPIITGVGHETDFTIADFVADLRAPTPSAAAEIVVRTRQEFEKHVVELQRRAEHRMRYVVLEWRHRVRDLESHRAFRQLEQFVRRRRQQVDEYASALFEGLRARMKETQRRLTVSSARVASFDLRGRADAFRLRLSRRDAELRGALERVVGRKRRRFNAAQMRVASFDLGARLERLRRRHERAADELKVRVDHLLAAKRRSFAAADVRLHERDPLQLLERGYAIAYDAEGRVLRSPDQVAIGDDISVRLARGELGATVKSRKTNKP